MRLIAWLLILALLVPAPAVAQIITPGGSGSSSTTNVTGGPTELDAAEETEDVALEGRQGVHVSWPSNDLDGTVTPECSLDGGTNYVGSQFIDPTSGQESLSYAGDGNNDADSFGIFVPTGATHCRVRVSAWTSGSITPTLTATTMRPVVLIAGTDENNVRVPVVTNTTPDSGDYALVVRFVGNTATGTSMTDDAAVTVGTTAFTPIGGTYKSTLDSVDDNDGGILAMTQKRALYVSCLTPAGDSCDDDTNDARKVTLVTVATIGGKSADATTTNYVNCTSQYNAKTTGAGTIEYLNPGAGERIYVCGMVIYTEAANDVTIVEGTGTNCGTGQSTIIGPLDLAANQGLVMGPSLVPIFDGVAEDNNICVTTTAAATVFFRYSSFPD